jgi:hypothetical protein
MRWLETIATADGRNNESEVGMFWVAALFHQVLRSLMAAANLHELLLVPLIVLTKMSTETTLTIVNMCHN